jgi:hypothetical protein
VTRVVGAGAALLACRPPVRGPGLVVVTGARAIVCPRTAPLLRPHRPARRRRVPRGLFHGPDV